jgi:hypothetical protein
VPREQREDAAALVVGVGSGVDGPDGGDGGPAVLELPSRKRAETDDSVAGCRVDRYPGG